MTVEDKASVLKSELINDEVLPYRLERLATMIVNNRLDIKYIIEKTRSEKYYNEIKLFNEIEQKSKGAWELLKYLAYLDPNQIDTRILSEITGKRIEKIENEINVLSNSSLVKILPNKKLTISRMTQDIVRKHLKEEVKEILEKNKVCNETP